MPLPSSAQQIIRHVLDTYGLGSLADWAWGRVKDLGDIDLAKAQIDVELWDRPEFRQRFPALIERRRRGLPAISPADYLRIEESYRTSARYYEMPSGMFDEPSELAQLIVADVSPSEFEERVKEGWHRVARAAPEVRDTFAGYFGAKGDAALAAFFVDPDRATSALLRQAQQATVGGRATQAGIGGLSAAGAERLVTGVGEQAALQAVGRAAEQRGLYRETASEAVDLTGEQGALAAAGLDTSAEEALRRRAQSREAQMAGAGQQAVTQEGILGAGTAGR